MAPRPIFLSHPSSLEHDTGAHPENIARLITVQAALQQRDYLGWETVQPRAADRDVLLRIHPGRYIDRLAAISERGGGQIDQDTIMSEGSFRAALYSAGGAIEMVTRLLEEGAGAIGFSAHRPPGHHATRMQSMGFCLFNNVAVATQHALDGLGAQRVMILDWDVHHGNGTQDIFWETDRVLFTSIHQSPLYPGTGSGLEIGAGPGEGYTVNLPVPPGSGDPQFVSLVRDVAVPLARAYRPELLLVSAGYDAHRDDPLADCMVTDAGFATMAALWRDLAHELEVPLGCVLEGGYNTAALARSVVATMATLAADPGSGITLDVDGSEVARDQGPAAGPRAELATDALARLAPRWPGLSTES